MLLYAKFGQHRPLNRQTERYALEGCRSVLSTAINAVGGVLHGIGALLRPPMEAHVIASERLHGGDTTVPVLAFGQVRCP